jgi:outer membrane biosynthesis protein TonB
MPILETPPNPASQPPDAPPETSSGRVRAGRFGELDHSELIHLLDSLDDERAKARFRESIYISLFFWMAVLGLLIFAPRIFPALPQFVQPTGSKSKQITSLSIPADVQKALEHAPRFKATPKAAAGPKTPEPAQQQPAPPAPQPPKQQTPAAQPNQAPQAAAPPPPPAVVQQSPFQQPKPPQTAPLPSAPAPSATRPDFGNPNTSARDMVQQATRAPHGGGGVTMGGDQGGPVERRGLGTGVDILSDTQGVDFNPYLQKIMREIYETWLPLIPEEARPPLNKQGETQIRFIILPNGKIGGMILEGSTHDDAINKSCWGSITGVGQFPPLPNQFHGPNLELRVRYLVNKEVR